MDHLGDDQTLQNIGSQSVIKEDKGFVYNNERFPGATVLELPLESAASGVIRWAALYLTCIDLLLRYLFLVNSL